MLINLPVINLREINSESEFNQFMLLLLLYFFIINYQPILPDTKTTSSFPLRLSARCRRLASYQCESVGSSRVALQAEALNRTLFPYLRHMPSGA